MTPFDIPKPETCFVRYIEESYNHVMFSISVSPITTEPPIYSYINEIANLQSNWDGHGATPPNISTLSHVKGFLENLENEIFSKITEENIIANPHGTITIRLGNKTNYANIEFGEKYANYYAFLNGEIKYRGEKITSLTHIVPYEVKLAISELR